MNDGRRVTVEENRLRRGAISLPDTIAQSVAMMAPALSGTFISYLAAIKAGGATPLAFLLAMGGCLFIGSVVNQFARRLPSAGSLYTYTVHGLGAFWGFVVGWTYSFGGVFYCPAALAGFAVFTSLVMRNVDAPAVFQEWWFWFALGLAVYFLLSYFGIEFSTRSQLAMTAATMATLLLLAVIIIGKGGAHGNTFDAFSPGAAGVSWPLVFGGLAFAMSSFAGFETAAMLAEESRNPQRDIPRAVIGAVVLGGTFYVLVTYATSIGYGVREATTAWPESTGGLSALTARYAPFLGNWVLLAGGLAALFSGLGTHNAVARLLYAMGREGVAPRVLGRTHRTHKTPHIAIILNLLFIVVVAALVIGTTERSSRDAIGASPGPLSSGFYLFAEGSTLTIPLLTLSYALLSVAGIRIGIQTDGPGLRTARRIVISSGSLLAAATALFGSLYYSFNEVAPDAGIPGPSRIVPLVMALVLAGASIAGAAVRFRRRDSWRNMGTIFE